MSEWRMLEIWSLLKIELRVKCRCVGDGSAFLPAFWLAQGCPTKRAGDGGTLRGFQAFFWLRVFSPLEAESTPAPRA